MELNDKVAIVVGGASGIGRATAARLAQAGASVMIADVLKEKADRIADDIRAKGGEASTVAVDFRHEEECNEMVRVTLEKYGKIDILVNVAGGIVGTLKSTNLTGNLPMQAPVAEQTKEMWDFIVDINLNGPRNSVRAVINHMMERGSGKIVNFSSIAVVDGLANNSDYTAAKAGVVGFTKALAREVVSYGIQANCITPSGTWAEHGRDLEEEIRRREERDERAASMFPIMPEEVAEAVLFLVGFGSDHMSGQNIIFGTPRQPA